MLLVIRCHDQFTAAGDTGRLHLDGYDANQGDDGAFLGPSAARNVAVIALIPYWVEGHFYFTHRALHVDRPYLRQVHPQLPPQGGQPRAMVEVVDVPRRAPPLSHGVSAPADHAVYGKFDFVLDQFSGCTSTSTASTIRRSTLVGISAWDFDFDRQFVHTVLRSTPPPTCAVRYTLLSL